MFYRQRSRCLYRDVRKASFSGRSQSDTDLEGPQRFLRRKMYHERFLLNTIRGRKVIRFDLLCIELAFKDEHDMVATLIGEPQRALFGRKLVLPLRIEVKAPFGRCLLVLERIVNDGDSAAYHYFPRYTIPFGTLAEHDRIVITELDARESRVRPHAMPSKIHTLNGLASPSDLQPIMGCLPAKPRPRFFITVINIRTGIGHYRKPPQIDDRAEVIIVRVGAIACATHTELASADKCKRILHMNGRLFRFREVSMLEGRSRCSRTKEIRLPRVGIALEIDRPAIIGIAVTNDFAIHC